MAGRSAGDRAGMTLGARLARMPTGAKVFLILLGVLAPFAVAAVLATLSTTRTAGMDSHTQLRIAAQESGRQLAIELIGDMTALKAAMNALAADPGDAPSCARVQGVFAQQGAAGASFMIADRRGAMLCGQPLPVPVPAAPPGGAAVSRIVPDRGVMLAIVNRDGAARGAAFFPLTMLRTTARPSAFSGDYTETLRAGAGGDALVLRTPAERSALSLHPTENVVLNIGDLTLGMSTSAEVFTQPLMLSLLVPIAMWLLAAGVAWLMVDRMLVRPLRKLRTQIAAYRPGEVIDVSSIKSLPAQEIRELGETFRSLSRTLILHEAGLAEGLVRQTKLTREVHHRVKNNLQVISSLINLHSRGARDEEVVMAYASIQRRVDALSAVHRHHFAEMEDNRGLSVRAVVGELASNIRATSPEGAKMTIVLEIEPFLVSQDVAIAIAFLLTEIVELATRIDPAAQLRLSVREGEKPGTAVLRVSSPALIDSDRLKTALAQRYGRVMEGLARQLRSPLHNDPLAGSYEIAVPVTARD